MSKPLVYFLCTGNSCRSQMAHGFLEAVGGNKYEVKSAGLEAHGLNPRAVQVMKEADVDITDQTSDVIEQQTLQEADYIITLCGHADEHCPAVNNPKAKRWHWGFDDPAQAQGSEEEVMAKFRAVRDQIKGRIEAFVREGE
ncbi:arsenate reductase (thioredoxin) [Caldalkalibacillus salinus]|uniref:arsenate reductase (thioredoxin) n=1 Tax=Caldalkalibacillus salinus TaxID=2803787 RepID=UPI0019211E05|nr:arsenate reductase (thioredoxin) [Caldalkalibacillus salinus]